MTLSVIIVNHNVKFFLEQCLQSVLRAASRVEHEVVVWDNASSDGSRAYLEKRFPSVRFVWNGENLGFGRANNAGVRLSTGRYVLFLNPDTLLPEDCLLTTIRHLEEHPDAGALGVRMVNGEGEYLRESKRAFPTPMTAFFKLSGLAALFPRSARFARYHLGNLDPRRNHDVDVLAGAFMLVRRDVLEETGGFDEDFFMYGEDIDLSYRIRSAGYRNLYFAGTTVLHFKGESTRKKTIRYVRMFYKAMAVFAAKHYGGWKAGIFSLFLHIGIWGRAALSASRILAARIPIPSRRRPDGRSEAAKNPGMKILAVCSPEDMDRVGRIVQAATGTRQPLGRVAHKEDQHGDNALEGMLNLLRRVEADAVVFCPDEISYADAIRTAERMPLGLRTLFSAKGSGSIVGTGYGRGTDTPSP